LCFDDLPFGKRWEKAISSTLFQTIYISFYIHLSSWLALQNRGPSKQIFLCILVYLDPKYIEKYKPEEVIYKKDNEE